MDNMERILGRLEAGFTGLAENVDRVLKGQESARVENEDSRRRIYERIEKTEGQFEESIHRINETLIMVNATLAKLTPMVDAVESNSDSILDLERRVDTHEKKLTAQDSVNTAVDGRLRSYEDSMKERRRDTDRDKLWAKSLLFGVAAVEGDHIAGWRLAKFLGSLFGVGGK